MVDYEQDAGEENMLKPALVARLKFDLERVDSTIAAVNDAYERAMSFKVEPIDLDPIFTRLDAIEQGGTGEGTLFALVEKLNQRVSTLESSLSSIIESVNSLHGELRQQSSTQITALGAQEKRLSALIGDVSSFRHLVAEHVNGLQARLTEQATQVGGLGHLVDDLTAQAKGAMEQIDAAIGVLRDDADTHGHASVDEDLQTLATQLDAFAEQHNALVAHVDEALQAYMTRNEVADVVAALETIIEAVDAKHSAHGHPAPDLSGLAKVAHVHKEAPLPSHTHGLGDLPALEHAHDFLQTTVRPDGSSIFTCQVQGCTAQLSLREK